MNKNKNILIKFLILYFFYLLSQAAIVSFCTALFKNRGLNPSITGAVCFTQRFASGIGFLVLGTILNRIGKNRVPIILFLFTSLILYVLLYFYTKNPYVFILFGLIGFLFDPVSAFIDSWILGSGEDTFKSFAKIKTVATFIYSCCFILLSYLIDQFGFVVCLVTSTTALTICIITALVTPEIRRECPDNKNQIDNRISIIDTLKFGIKNISVYLIIAFFMGLSCTSLLMYAPYILEDIGASGVYQGLGLFLCYSGSSIFTLLSVKLQKINVLVKTCTGVFGMIIGLVLINFFPSPLTLVFGFLMRGIADSLILVSFRNYVKKEIPNNLQTFSHSAFNSSYYSIGAAIGIAISGKLFNVYGFSGLAIFCCSTAFISIIISIVYMIINRKAV